MRADTALSHLKDGEHCIAKTKEGNQDVRWSVADWCFYHADTVAPTVCRFEDIVEWHPASIKIY
jgi:hypothetical protein